MSRTISLKSRIRYEGRAQTIDRRATKGADLERLPNPIWRSVGLILRAKPFQATTGEKAPEGK
jgi:hypothetical protein